MALFVSGLTLISVFLSILFFPEIKIGRVKLGSFWVISLIGAILVLIIKADLSTLIKGLTANSSVNPIKILILFFSMTLLSVFLDEMGFFEYLASLALKRSGKSQLKLFVTLYIVVSILTIFTSNDIVILTFTPFICFFCKKANVNPVPYLIAEFVGANTWSMFLIIGNPTNIYLASSFNVGFIEYFRVMLLPTIGAGIISFLVLLLIFKKSLSKEIRVEGFIIHVKNRSMVIIGLIHLACCTLLLAVSSYLKLEMWLVSLFFAISLILFAISYLVIHKTGLKVVFKTFSRLPYELIPFVLSMFTIVLFLGEEVTGKIANLLSKGNPIYTYGFSSFLSSNLLNNIPMSVLFSRILQSSFLGEELLKGVFATIIGSNIGAYLTPVGALAGIMWMSILKKEGVKLSFLRFTLYGLAISVVAILVSLILLNFSF